MKNKVIQVFLDTDMRYSFHGLIQICTENKIKIEEKEHGEFIVFLNTKRNYLKIIACNGTEYPILAAYQVPNRIIDLRIISHIPKAFNASGRFEIDKATQVFLESKNLGH